MAQEKLPLLDRFKWIIGSFLGLMIVVALAYLLLNQDEPVTITINPPPPTATHTPTETPAPLEIYVTGAVVQPESRHSLPQGARVEDAIAAAGGITEDANLTGVNLAQLLRDGDQVHVPSTVSAEAPSVDAEVPTPNAPRLLNINTATQAELETLPRIGPSTAQAIIEYRDANGPFVTIDDLVEVPGIGPATLENLRELISVE
jgi:competence protein ComEA